MMTMKISKKDLEALSAYLDNQLTARDRARLETRLQENDDLRTALEDLRRTRAILRAQPKMRAPRNFTLTPEMVGQRIPQRKQQPLFQTLRFAAVAISLLFVFVVIGDLMFGSSMNALEPLAEAPRNEIVTQVVSKPGSDESAAMMVLPEPQESPQESQEQSTPEEIVKTVAVGLSSDVSPTLTENLESEALIVEDVPVQIESAKELETPEVQIVLESPSQSERAIPTPTVAALVIERVQPTIVAKAIYPQPIAPELIPTPSPVPNWLNNWVFGAPITRVLELAIALAAISMWVAVWFLRRR